MSITALSPEAVSTRATQLIERLKGLNIKKVTWTIYDDSDENNLVDVVCIDTDQKTELGIEDEGILWDMSELFLCETGMFEVEVDVGLIKRLGDAYIPEGLEYDYLETPETLQAHLPDQPTQVNTHESQTNN
jgi:hypothetical protein